MHERRRLPLPRAAPVAAPGAPVVAHPVDDERGRLQLLGREPNLSGHENTPALAVSRPFMNDADAAPYGVQLFQERTAAV